VLTLRRKAESMPGKVESELKFTFPPEGLARVRAALGKVTDGSRERRRLVSRYFDRAAGAGTGLSRQYPRRPGEGGIPGGADQEAARRRRSNDRICRGSSRTAGGKRRRQTRESLGGLPRSHEFAAILSAKPLAPLVL